MTIFKGSGTAIITPFHEDGSVNFEKLEQLIDFQIDNKTDAIIICGTTGEAAAMNDDEHLECIKVAVNRVNKRIPVIAGTGSNDTRHGIKLTTQARILGADATLQVTPYYNKTTQKGLIKHFEAIANASDLPMILYNVPSRTGMSMSSNTIHELSKRDFVIGLKEASGDISHVAKVASLCGDTLPIYSGNDDQIVPILSLGGQGVISVISNVAPLMTHNLVTSYLEGDVETARKLQLQHLDLMNHLFCEVNPIPVKEALNLMGFEVGPCRAPLYEIDSNNRENLKAALIRANLLD